MKTINKNSNSLYHTIIFILSAIILCLLSVLYLNWEDRKNNEEFCKDIDDIKNDSLIVEILDVEKNVNGDSIVSKYHYYIKDGKAIKYHDLKKENDSLKDIILDNNYEMWELNNKLISTEYDLDLYKSKLNLVTKNYPISFKENKNSTSIESKQLDSALMLLDHFRHKMFYNKETNSWVFK